MKRIELNAQELAAIEKIWNAHPGMKHMGARIDLSNTSSLRVYIDPVEQHHRGGLGTNAVNGVVIAGLFDLAVGLTGFIHGGARRTGVVQLNVHYMKPLTGDRIDILAKPSRVGRRLVFVNAVAHDQESRVCAAADGISVLLGEERMLDFAEAAI